MCAACVAQGIAYVGGALGGLQVMAMRASARRRRRETDADVVDESDIVDVDGIDHEPEPSPTT